MINYFIGRQRDWLEEQLRIAQDDLAAGKTVTSAGAGDSQVNERVEVPIKERIEQLMLALNAFDPKKYPLSQIRRVTRTQVQIYPNSYLGGYAG